MVIAPLVFIKTHEINGDRFTQSWRVFRNSEYACKVCFSFPSVVNLIYSVCRNETVKHKGQRRNTGIYAQLFQVFRFKVNWRNHRGLWRKVRPMEGWAYSEEFIWWEEEFVFLTWVLRLKHRYAESKGSILVDSSSSGLLKKKKKKNKVDPLRNTCFGLNKFVTVPP